MTKKLACLLGISFTVFARDFVLSIQKIDPNILPTNKEKRISSYPFLSGDTYRAFCDHIVDETGIPFNPTKVKSGDTIFVTARLIDQFFNDIHSHIPERYILVTHNTNDLVPGRCASYLDDHKLYAWFAKNVNVSHPKLHPLPLGFANRYWPHGDVNIIREMLSQAPMKKDKLLYMNFANHTNPGKRKKVFEFFKDKLYCYRASRKPFKEYLNDLATSKFVLSPLGSGTDCHRTWEALIMGSFVITEHSPIDALFEGLPVILIDDWSEVTQEFLEAAYANMQHIEYRYERLYADYWFNKIRGFQEKARR